VTISQATSEIRRRKKDEERIKKQKAKPNGRLAGGHKLFIYVNGGSVIPIPNRYRGIFKY